MATGYGDPMTPSTFDQAVQQLSEAIKTEKVEVPVLPETAQRVIALLQDPDSDAAQLATVIQADPTMGGHVMRIANSAAYTPNSNLVSIQQAVARLGMVEISNIAFSTALNSRLFKAPGYESIISTIWHRALCTALWSKEVARAMRSNVEAAFLCGLLHSIGQPVILQTIANEEGGESEPFNEPTLNQLFTKFERNYTETVGRQWELPAIVTEAISYHQHFNDAPTTPELAATIFLGNQLARLMLDPEATTTADILDSPALDLVNLYPDQLEILLAKTDTLKTAMDTLSQ